MWPFASCGYNSPDAVDAGPNSPADEVIWGGTPDTGFVEEDYSVSDGLSSPNFSEENVVIVTRSEQTLSDDELDYEDVVKTIDLARAVNVNDEPSSSIFCAVNPEPEHSDVGADSPAAKGSVSNEHVIRTQGTLLRASIDHDVYNSFEDTLHSNARARISRLQGDISPSRKVTTARVRRRESTTAPSLVMHRDSGELQDYASATSAVYASLQAESRLHAWLITHGLARYYGAICDLGAKKISDLALLTEDDMDDLGLTPEERKKLNIRIMA